MVMRPRFERLNFSPPTHTHISRSIFCALTTHSGKVWRISLFKALSLYGVTASFSFQFQWYVPVYFTDFSFESFRPLAQVNNKSNLGAWVFYRLWQCQYHRFSGGLGQKTTGSMWRRSSASRLGGWIEPPWFTITTYRERKPGKHFWVPIGLSTTIQVFPSNTNNVFTKPITDPTWQQFSIIGPGWLTWW